MFWLLALSSVFVGLFYVFEIVFIHQNWSKTIPLDLSNKLHTLPTVAVVVVARNESENILTCIKTIQENNYPKHLFEIIVVNDHSTDGTLDILKAIDGITVLDLKDHLIESQTLAFKKKAVEVGIKNSSAEIILQTDADCIVPQNWISLTVDQFVSNDYDFVAGPVIFKISNTPLSRFECLDFCGMMAITAAGLESKKWHMANGANMAFKKSIFQKIKQNLEFASGDDIHLVQALEIKNANIKFLNSIENTVVTNGNKTFSSFFNQRIRWATKNKYATSWNYKFMMLIPYIYSILFFLALLLSLFNIHYIVLFLFLLFQKYAIDYYFLKQTSEYYEQSEQMHKFLFSLINHLLYIFVFGSLSLVIKNYTWKGRRVQ